MYDKQDPFEWFRSRASANAVAWGYSPEIVNDSIHVLSTALGQQWLINEMHKKERGTPIPFVPHPLATAFKTASYKSTIQALEIAHYLQHFAIHQRVGVVINGLREQFDSTVLHLAMAYRFDCVCEQIVLEPPVEKGRVGDIHVQSDHLSAIFECYFPRFQAASVDSREFQFLAQKALDVLPPVSPRKRTFSIAVIIQTPTLTPDLRKVIVSEVKRLASIIDTGAYDHLPPEYIAGDGYSLSVALSFPSVSGKPSNLVLHHCFHDHDRNDLKIFMSVGKAPITEFGLIDKEPSYPKSSHIAVFRSHDQFDLIALDELISMLVKKIEKKVSQTSKLGVRRAIVVQSRLVLEMMDEPYAQLERSCNSLFSLHDRLDAVLFVYRHFDFHLRRFKYDYRAVFSPKANAEIICLIRRLVEKEIDSLLPSCITQYQL
jgi:hypothetical protein